MPPLRNLKLISQKKSRHWYEYATWLSYLIVIVILASGGFFLLKPRYDNILSIRQQTGASSEEQQQKKRSLDNTHKLIDNARTVGESERARLSYMMPSGPDLPGVFVQLEALAQSSGLAMQSISIDEKGKQDPKAPGVFALPFDISYQVSTRDPYQVLEQSLAAFEENLRIFDIQSFSFEVKDEANNADTQNSSISEAAKRTMQMKFFTYYFPQK